MTCGNCIHSKVCKQVLNSTDKITRYSRNNCADECEHYEDKTTFVKLPCKVGDIVKPTDETESGSVYQVTSVQITQNKRGKWTKKYRAIKCTDGSYIGAQYDFDFDDVGVKVFLVNEDKKSPPRGKSKVN